MRCFISFDLEDEAVLRKIEEAQRLLETTGNSLKIVNPRSIHITLRFLGDIAPKVAESIIEEMRSLEFKPFDVKFVGLGAFRDLRHINVIWVGIGSGADQLGRLYDQLEPRLKRLGLRPDPKGFSPHLTIARVRAIRDREALVRVLRENSTTPFGSIRAERLRLKRSVLKPEGPVYSTLGEVEGR